MDGEWLGTGNKFKGGDKVLIASKEACSKIHPISTLRSDQGTASFFNLIGTVESVMPTGDVKVTFGKDIQCTIEPEAVVKMRNFLPADLVQVVDDIRCGGNLELENGHNYNEASKVCGPIGIVLSNCTDLADEIDVAIAGDHKTFNRIRLDFVGRLSYGDYTARVREYTCKSEDSDEVSDDLLKNVSAALQKSMDDLPDIHMLSNSTSSPFVPGDVVEVSSEVAEFLGWHMDLTANDPTTDFRTLQDYACIGDNGWRMGPFPAEQVASLLEPGKVADVSADGDAIVTFNDGRSWCFRPWFLQRVEGREARCADARTRATINCSEHIELIIRSIGRHVSPMAALRAACYFGELDCVSTEDVDFCGNGADSNGNTLMHYAAHGNQAEMLATLLCVEANINATNKRHDTALHIAVKEGFVRSVRKLVDRGKLDVNMQDDIGNTALHVAIATMNNEIAKELINHSEVNFEITNQYGLNALHVAALKGNAWAALIILLKRSDLVNQPQKDQGYAALHLAALEGHYHVVEVLLKQDWCTVDLQNKHEETALVVAARNNHWRIVDLLLLAGANVNSVDRHGNTALHMSLMDGKERPQKPVDMPSNHALKAIEKTILERGYPGDASRLQFSCFLVRFGADIGCPNKEGVTPLDIASRLEEPAGELLKFFKSQAWDASQGNCKICFEAPADISFMPCGDGLYCRECAGPMQCCPSCGVVIIRMRITGTGSDSSNAIHKLRVVERFPAKYELGAYKMERNPRGLCIIINNIDFPGEDIHRREGSDLDAERMNSLFLQLHFLVALRTNLSASEMQDYLQWAAKSEIQNISECLVVILMSHGMEDVILGSDGEPVHLREEVYNLFNNANCPLLKGKPKLFFVQACRGEEYNSATSDAAGSLVPDAAQPKLTPEWADMYFAYATIPDYGALRDTKKGSWFITIIFSVFRKYAATTDLEALMHRVAKDMMRLSTPARKMQTPNIDMYGWRGKLFFNPGHWKYSNTWETLYDQEP